MASPNILMPVPESSPQWRPAPMEVLQSLATDAALASLDRTMPPAHHSIGTAANPPLALTMEKEGGDELPRRTPDKSGGPIEKAGGSKGNGENGDDSKELPRREPGKQLEPPPSGEEERRRQKRESDE